MSKLFSLEGRVALVTGASRGLGWAIAETFAEHGAEVVLASRDQSALDRRAGSLAARGHKAHAMAFDVAEPGMLEGLRSGQRVDFSLEHAQGRYQIVQISARRE